MQKSKEYVHKAKKKNPKWLKTFLDDDSLPFDLYFNKEARDLGLLITLLASRNGVSEGLRLLSFFDKDYKILWRPVDTNVTFDPDEAQKVSIMHFQYLID